MLQQTTTLWSIVKNHLFEFLTFAFFWLSPIHGLILFILLAAGVDTFMGRKAARLKAINEGKEPRLEVTSKKTRIGFTSKVATYIGLLILTLFLDKMMLNDLLLYFIPTFPIHFVISKGLGLIFLAIEFDSIDEKYFLISGKRLKDTIKRKISAIKVTILGAKKFKNELKED
jgi:hypothetical protein